MPFETVSFREERIGRAMAETDEAGGFACATARRPGPGRRTPHPGSSGQQRDNDLLIADGGGRIAGIR